MQNQIDLVTFGPEHLDEAVALSRSESWPHRREDWAMVQKLSAGVVATNSDGRVTGTTFMTPFGNDYATINMVIVDKSMRGLGLGRKLMERAFELAGKRPLRLIATKEGLPLYEKLGFIATGTIRQHQGEVHAVERPQGVEDMQAGDVEAVRALDREACGADRSALLDALLERGRIAVVRKGDAIEAWAAIRPFGRGEVIGPVIAPDAKTACALIAYFACSREGSFLRVDTGSETGLAPWLSEIGLAHVGGGVTMRRPLTEDAGEPQHKIFALVSQALG
ncbi:GNAT superfamily N-acetyltransferase [Rhizobium mesoamericanum]|uniref:GNAT family N-acetyltransferase n=1 Tax=Rhizobium mesoamericanum TaxID=1079800 RepID=UPI002781FE4C|nr:GNAT family N-acetyltransferase [Rhizobium mesoamericanum]MDQ0559163.1 GNAT superfamily N-acetyltransferase [Rhizobium mesoamericanum]